MSETKKVVMYIFKHCPYCVKAKKLLDKENIPYTEIEVTNEELNELEKQTRLGTVPQILVNDELIGGCDDLYKLYSNKAEFDKTFH